MTEAKEAKGLVTRIVIGPKPIHGYDAEGKKCIYGVGETIQLTPNAANRFARYLQSPEVAKAQVAVQEATAKAATEGAKPTTKPQPQPPKPPAKPLLKPGGEA